VLVLLSAAVLGCAAFAWAQGLAALTAARVLIGAGVGACLMAPLTLYRRLFSDAAQLRANSWMLMTGSLGMLASTLPVQWLLPQIGWRGLFWCLAGLLALGMALIAWKVPPDPAPGSGKGPAVRYRDIVRHPMFMRMAPLGFFLYGGMIAVQSLWAGPWLTRVTGLAPAAAAEGLFGINLAMLAAFFSWGWLMPRLVRKGFDAAGLMALGVPVALVLLFVNAALGAEAGAVHWALWCVASTFVSVSQPAVGAAFPSEQAGRALSAFNLVIFSGVFSVQWGIGLLVDALRRTGLAEADAFRAAFAVLGAACLLAYAWFMHRRPAPNP
jgi:predicted MFS family arabinose efflux permease